jgi:hypothetical protein
MKFAPESLSLAMALTASIAVSACGGGGSSSSTSSTTPTFDSTPFQGTWRRNDRTVSGSAANCFNFDTYGGTFGGLNRSIVTTDTTLTATIEVYSDTTCTTYLGLLVTNYSMAFSAGSIAGKTTVAKALVTSTGFSINRDGAAGFSLTSPPQSGVVDKMVLDVEGTLMYLGNYSGTLDSDGYPTTLQDSALYTR